MSEFGDLLRQIKADHDRRRQEENKLVAQAEAQRQAISSASTAVTGLMSRVANGFIRDMGWSERRQPREIGSVRSWVFCGNVGNNASAGMEVVIDCSYLGYLSVQVRTSVKPAGEKKFSVSTTDLRSFPVDVNDAQFAGWLRECLADAFKALLAKN